MDSICFCLAFCERVHVVKNAGVHHPLQSTHVTLADFGHRSAESTYTSPHVHVSSACNSIGAVVHLPPLSPTEDHRVPTEPALVQEASEASEDLWAFARVTAAEAAVGGVRRRRIPWAKENGEMVSFQGVLLRRLKLFLGLMNGGHANEHDIVGNMTRDKH